MGKSTRNPEKPMSSVGSGAFITSPVTKKSGL